MPELSFPSVLDLCDWGGCPALGTEDFPVGEFRLRFCAHHNREANANAYGFEMRPGLDQRNASQERTTDVAHDHPAR